MSKRHSYSSDRSAEDQYDASDAELTNDSDPADEADDDALDDDGFPQGASLLSREAKIGMAVVLVLLLVVGAVLYKRLTGPTDSADKQSPAAAEADKKKGADSGETPTKAAAASTPKPIVLESRPGSSRHAPVSDVGQWAVASDGNAQAKSPGKSGVASPSYMPSETSGTGQRGRPDDYATARPSPKMGSSWQTGEAGASDASSTGQSYDPLGSRSPSAAAPNTLYSQGATSSPAYTPAASVSPARPTLPGGAGSSSSPTTDNPLRGQGQNTIIVEPSAAATPGTTGATSAGGYRASAYGPTTAGQYGQTGAPLGPSPSAGIAGQSPLRAGDASAGTAQYGPATTGPSSYGATAPGASAYGAGPSGLDRHGSTGSTTASGAPLYGAGGATASSPIASSYSPSGQRRADGTYVVQPTETYWSISEKLYGTGAYFKALAEHNRDKVPHPDRLKVGDVIRAPTREQLEQTYADLCPKPSHVDAARRQAMSLASGPAQYGTGKTYTVQQGDTLWDIAKYELGKPARWVEIYELNKEVLGEDLDHLRPGTRLALPGGERPDTLTRRPGDGMQR